MVSKRVTITAEGMKCLNVGVDPGDELEVYGSLGVGVGRGDQADEDKFRLKNFLWQANDPISVPQGIFVKFEANNVFQFDMNEDEFVKFGGILAENDDTSENDELGKHTKTLLFNDINTGSNPQVFPIIFEEKDQKIQVNFLVSAT